MVTVSEEQKEKNPNRVAQGKRIAAMPKDYFGGKPGPKIHKSEVDFFEYLLPRMDKERTDISFFIDYYKKQHFTLRAKIANSPQFKELLIALQADIGFGLYKPRREEWTALSGMFARIAKVQIEQEKSERKRINKADAKRHKSGQEIMTSLDVSTEDEGD